MTIADCGRALAPPNVNLGPVAPTSRTRLPFIHLTPHCSCQADKKKEKMTIEDVRKNKGLAKLLVLLARAKKDEERRQALAEAKAKYGQRENVQAGGEKEGGEGGVEAQVPVQQEAAEPASS